MYYQVPKIWTDETAFILGGGPSLLSVDMDSLVGSNIIATNNAYQMGDFVDFCYFTDQDWYRWHEDGLKEFKGAVVTDCVELRHLNHLNVLKRDRRVGFAHRSDTIRWNFSSGGAAINLAYLLGAKRIVLLGYDMRVIDGEKNYHNDHQEDSNKNPYDRFLRAFPYIKADADKAGVEILNATPDSAIKQFDFVDLEEVI